MSDNREKGPTLSITGLIMQFINIREELEKYAVRDIGDYAELLVARALRAKRNASRVGKGFDVVSRKLGKIEVRSRTLPRDGRNETRLQVPKEQVGHFDYFAGILFDPNISVVGGFLLPHDDTIDLAGKQKFLRIPFEIGMHHRKALNITDKLRRAQNET